MKHLNDGSRDASAYELFGCSEEELVRHIRDVLREADTDGTRFATKSVTGPRRTWSKAWCGTVMEPLQLTLWPDHALPGQLALFNRRASVGIYSEGASRYCECSDAVVVPLFRGTCSSPAKPSCRICTEPQEPPPHGPKPRRQRLPFVENCPLSGNRKQSEFRNSRRRRRARRCCRQRKEFPRISN